MILLIMSKADSGCKTCVANLFEEFIYVFPQYLNEVIEMWEADYPSYGMHDAELARFKAAHKKVS